MLQVQRVVRGERRPLPPRQLRSEPLRVLRDDIRPANPAPDRVAGADARDDLQGKAEDDPLSALALSLGVTLAFRNPHDLRHEQGREGGRARQRSSRQLAPGARRRGGGWRRE